MFCARTLFADQTIVSVVGIVGISGCRASAIADDTEIELYKEEQSQSRSLGSKRRRINGPRDAHLGTRGRNDQNGPSLAG